MSINVSLTINADTTNSEMQLKFICVHLKQLGPNTCQDEEEEKYSNIKIKNPRKS